MTTPPLNDTGQEEKPYEFPLTKGQVAVVDACDAHLASFGWFAAYDPASKRYYAKRCISMGSYLTRRQVSLHHAILGRPINKRWKVDHLNGDGLDNRRCNLRFVTHGQNRSNTVAKRQGKTSSRFPGVCFDKKNSKWRAQITMDGTPIWLGYHMTEQDAFEAYEAKRLLSEKKGGS